MGVPVQHRVGARVDEFGGRLIVLPQESARLDRNRRTVGEFARRHLHQTWGEQVGWVR